MVRWKTWRQVFAAMTFVALAGAATGAEVPDITGQVVSATGRPIAAADVRLEPRGTPARVTIADASGRFQFAGVEPGEYRLTARAAGFSPVSELVIVTAARPLAVTLLLPDVVQERVNVVGDPRLVDRIGGSAHVLGRRELERVQLVTNDIHQMLRQVPGVNIQEEDGYGLRPNIGMRGTGTDRTSKITMMEDGVLVAPAPYAAPAAYYAPTPGRMESLEVRKGSSQIKHGPITTGGVLNYISTAIPPSFQVRTTVVGGGDNLRRISAALGDSRERYGWLVETYQFRTDGFKDLDGGGDTGVDLSDYLAKFRVNSRPSATSYQEVEIKVGRTDQVGDETYLGLTDADFAATPFRRYAASQLDKIDSSHEQYQVRHLFARPTWDVTTVAYRNDFHRAWYKLESVLGTGLSGILASPAAHAERMAVLSGGNSAPNALTVRNNNRTYYGAGVQSILGVRFGGGVVTHQLEAGVRHHQDEEDRFQQDDGYQMFLGRMVLTRPGAPGSQANQIVSARATSGFILDTITWGRWTVTPGLRYEHIDLESVSYSRTDPNRAGPTTDVATGINAVVPGVGLTVAVRPGLGVFAGVHRGFAPPGPGAAAGTDVEHSVNYEAGVRAERGATRTEVVAFYNRYGNLLGRDSLATGGSGDGQLFNGGRAVVYGLEASWARDGGDLLGAGVALPVRLAYTFTQAEFRSSFQSQFGPWGTVEVGDALPYVPRHQLFASVAAEHRAWYGRLDAVAVGRMRTVAAQGDYLAAGSTEPSFVVNLSGERALTEDVRLFASLQNVFDRVSIVARHPAGVRPGLPRLFQAGLKFTLGR